MHRRTLCRFLAVLMLCSWQSLFAQIGLLPADDVRPGSYPIIGSHLLRAEEESVRKYLLGHPGMMNLMKLRKTAAWNFTVGTAHTWYSIDFTNSTRYPVTSTCRKVGTHCYIFVEDSLWNHRVTQPAVDSVEAAFDLRTPADPTTGIYQMDVNAFGNPPDVDNDPKIIILMLNIRDGYAGTGGYIAGYFSSYNETAQPQSNQKAP